MRFREIPAMRLQKYIAHAGLCSRRKAEEYILAGKIQVNGQTVTTLGTKVIPGTDQVTVDGHPVVVPQGNTHLYIALNKPKGVVTSCSQKHARLVVDLVQTEQRVYPVGRLDKDSEGLLLLTDDGNLHHRLSHPSFDHEKEYIVKTAYPIKDTDLRHMAGGMVIEGEKTRPATVKRMSRDTFTIVLKQGRNRQIRKMVAKTGNRVTSLVRIRMGTVRLKSLKSGQWRYLTTKEVNQLTQGLDADGLSDFVQKRG